MSQLREPAFDRAVAMVLRIGAFSCFTIMIAGLFLGFFIPGNIPLTIERVGVLLMLATPAVRVLVACVLFFREKDKKYGCGGYIYPCATGGMIGKFNRMFSGRRENKAGPSGNSTLHESELQRAVPECILPRSRLVWPMNCAVYAVAGRL